MKKETFNLLTRFIAGVAASLVLVGATAIAGEKMNEGRTGPFYQASGLKITDTMLTVDGVAVTVEEYLYDLTYQCNAAVSSGVSDLDMVLGEGVTAADYVKELAAYSITNSVVIESWAAEVGLALTAEDTAEMNAQLDSVDYAAAGISRQFLETQLRRSYLAGHIVNAYTTEGGALYPTAEAIEAAMAAGADHGHEHDEATVVMELCDEEFARRCTEAQIVYNEKYHSELNVKDFYAKMVALTAADAQ